MIQMRETCGQPPHLHRHGAHPTTMRSGDHRRLHRRGLGALVCLAMIAGLSLLAPPTASAAAGPVVDCATDTTGPSITGVFPTAVSVGITPVQVRMAPQVSDPCGVSFWQTTRGVWTYEQITATNTDPVARFPVPTRNEQAGYSDLLVAARDGSPAANATRVRFPFLLQRRATFERSTFDVQMPGTSITIDAKLIRANWELGHYDYFPGQRVQLQFRPKGKQQWQHIFFLTSNANAKVHAHYSFPTAGPSAYEGTWRLRYLGSEYTSSTTSPEVVVDSASGTTRASVRGVGSSAEGAVPAALMPQSLRGSATDAVGHDGAESTVHTGDVATDENAASPKGSSAGVSSVEVSGAGIARLPDLPTHPRPANPATPAAAPSQCSTDTSAPDLQGVSPDAVAVGLGPSSLPMFAQVSDPCGVADWQISYANSGYSFSVQSARPQALIRTPRWNAIAGYSTIGLQATDASPNLNSGSARFPFRLMRQSQWRPGSVYLTRAAYPNAPVVVRGQLQRANWERGSYQVAARQHVALQFRPEDSNHWQHHLMAVTEANGSIEIRSSSTVPDPRAGSWRLVYRGSEAFAPIASGTLRLA